MSTVVVWTHDSTVDADFRLDERIIGVAKYLTEAPEGRALLLDRIERAEDRDEDTLEYKLRRIADEGLKQDDRFYLKPEHVPTARDPEGELRDIMEGVHTYLYSNHGDVHEPNVGANPAISALRGAYLAVPREATCTLPWVYFLGLMPDNVRDELHARHQPVLDAFEFAQPIEHVRPTTIGLETAHAKMMLIHGTGRSWADFLRPDQADRERVLARLDSIQARHRPDKLVLGMNCPRRAEDMELAKGFVEAIRQRPWAADAFKLAVSTARLGGREAAKPLLAFLKDGLQPDIISASDDEIVDLHSAQYDGFVNIPIARKLRQLDFSAIKVCHGAYGVALDLGTRPEHIIVSRRFRDNPAGYLREVTAYAADGATFAIDTLARLGRTASELMVRNYSDQVAKDGRQEGQFNSTFLSVDKQLPSGMVATASARVDETLGAVVGAGAMFDGLLLSFLMRHDLS